ILSEEEITNQKKYHFMLGHGFFKEGKYLECIKEFEKVLELDPQHERSKDYINRAEEALK
ncbi:tetratricopeptide repeat protein, partial [Elusimicrobiota bacterium]